MGLNIHVVVNRRIHRVNHADLFALINIGSAAQQVNHGRQHGRRFRPIPLNVTKTVECTRLIMIIPKQRIPPAARLHAQRPIVEQTLQLSKAERHLRPLLAVLIIHLQMVKTKHHIELAVLRVGVAHAVLNARRRHFTHGHGIPIPPEGCTVQLPQTRMHDGRIGIQGLIDNPGGRILKLFGLADHVNDVEAEPANTLVIPEIDDLIEFLTHGGVVPVQISLCDVVKVQIVQRCPRFVPINLTRRIGERRPGRTAEFRLPVRGRNHRAVRLNPPRAKIEIIPVLALARLRPPKPLVLGRNVVEHHIEHDPDAVLPKRGDHLFDVLHRAQLGVNGVVVGNVVAVIVLGRGEERVEPHHAHPQRCHIGHLLDNAANIAGWPPVRRIE